MKRFIYYCEDCQSLIFVAEEINECDCGAKLDHTVGWDENDGQV